MIVGTSGWTSLEVVKLVVAALTAFAVVAAGSWINSRLKSREAGHAAQQNTVEGCIVAFDRLARSLNRLMCYCA
jgi:hypothetical protein